uniref:Peptidase S1 domain-containing protein n=1 Tax=Bubo bubo TaxID=30461 RepID=A0A8C0EX56_BUBBB
MKHLQKLLLSLLLVTYYSRNRMEGGGEAKTHSTPYVAYLQGKNNHFCGGFLVAPNWVMTAAQCFPLTVILGAHTIQRREESWQTFEVQEYHCHPDFMSPKKGNDILLLKLKGNATSNSYVRTISFEKSKVPGGTACSIAGWGYKTPAATLREATVTIIKQRDFSLFFANAPSSRGPSYGIFSYRHNNWPGFYTHIAPYLPWVNSVMKSA